MREIRSNKYLFFANIGAFIYFFLGHFIEFPDVIKGFCAGISIWFYLVGFYALKHDVNRLRNVKKNLLKKIIKY